MTPRQLQAPGSIAQHVADLLSDPERFTKGASARTKDGTSTHPRSETAVAWCVLGAIHHASRAGAVHGRVAVIREFNYELGTQYLTEFNDSVPGARKRIVAAALRVAKRLASNEP